MAARVQVEFEQESDGSRRMHLLHIRGVPIEFPFQPYPSQLLYMEKVIESLQQQQHALLESPTGTGKTLCLLCATLAWRKWYIHQQTGNPRGLYETPSTTTSQSSGTTTSGVGPRIIYSSRTHSQLNQVVAELKNTSYRPVVSVLGSRSQLCIHPEISSMYGNKQNASCRAAVSRRACRFYRQAKDHAKQLAHSSHQVLDIEELVRVGRERESCPYYLARELQSTGEILFLPYNYLIDPAIRSSLTVPLEDSVIILDEAHNIVRTPLLLFPPLWFCVCMSSSFLFPVYCHNMHTPALAWFSGVLWCSLA
mmetsp:Transcript_18440/g.46903  ORF Transcript_18440/g.46903 Transcript_18440/m.46903 type:complete len:309 (-) Transcript_18440:30-956(-)